MSTNPFRRSSLKDPSVGSGGSTSTAISSVPIDVPHAGTDTPTQLSLNTKVPSTNQKHVNFASPPAIPISPVSYPPSPESVRNSPAYTFSKPVLPLPTDYSSAIHSDPFRAEVGTDENDGAIEQALQNAKVNSALVEPSVAPVKEDAVKNTLSRFASAPKRGPAMSQDSGVVQSAAHNRPAMDVDAFKRLLLTGDSRQSGRQDEISNAAALQPPVISDNSSATDSASISQRSLFDQGPTTEDSPSSSDELDPIDAEATRRSVAPNESVEGKKKPAPPTPRHGKPLKNENAPLPLNNHIPPYAPRATNASKKPPAPPLSRRRSQNSDIARPSSSRQSSSSEVDQVLISEDSSSKAPPPPKPRRPGSMIERKPLPDLPSTAEEFHDTEPSTSPSRRPSGARPSPPPARNSSKRISMGTMNPPAPAPPAPRRGRGSSRSSVDSQRPPVSAILSGSGGEIEAPSSQTNIDSRQALSGSYANDILADLAALQREVDDARRKVSR